MTPPVARFPYRPFVTKDGSSGPAPLVPVRLGVAAPVLGLLDTGATVSVLPYSLGIALGLDWNGPHPPLRLGGNLAARPAKGVTVLAEVAPFAPVRLAFAWSASDDAPLLLGRTNFFAEFDACFYQTGGEFLLSRAVRARAP